MRPNDRIPTTPTPETHALPGILSTLVLKNEKQHLGSCSEYERECDCHSVCHSVSEYGNCMSNCDYTRVSERRGQYHG